MKFCPQCGTTLIPGDRFCLECGFDTSTIVPAVPENGQPMQPVISEEVIVPDTPAQQTVSPVDKKQFCPRCGTVIAFGDRFCPACGFNSLSATYEYPDEIKTSYAPPVDIPTAKPAEHLPVVEKTSYQQTPPPVEKAEPAPFNTPPVLAVTNQPKVKKSSLLLILVIVGVIVFGAGGWFAYNKYFIKNQAAQADTIVNPALGETAPAVAISTDTVSETGAEPVKNEVAMAPVKQKAKEKPLSKIDQELAKQKARKKSNTPQSTPKPSQEIYDLSVKAKPSQTVVEKQAKVIFEIGKKDDAKNKNPKNPTKITLDNPTMIIRITTDHYNSSMGTASAGTITIKDKYGSVIGSYKASGKPGKNGTPNAKWVAEPKKQLDPGVYFIWDSEMETWSKNLLGVGFVVVEGYEL